MSAPSPPTPAHSAWFNHERVHSYLEGLSPVQYRAQALAA
ncbi:IS3 family transposase [Nocardiopsis exhalans]